MDSKQILKDKLYNLTKESAGAYKDCGLFDDIMDALDSKDDSALIAKLNELMGFFRGKNDIPRAYEAADSCKLLIDQNEEISSISGATTLLNIASLYRAGARLDLSMECYERVKAIYKDILPDKSMLIAGVENSIADLYTEMGKFSEAYESLKHSLEIATANDEKLAIADAYADLSWNRWSMNSFDEAREFAIDCIEIYNALERSDAKLALSLFVLGLCHVRNRKQREGLDKFKESIAILEGDKLRSELLSRVCSKYDEVKTLMDMGINSGAGVLKGMDICREYYEKEFKPRLQAKYPELVNKVAVGLVGRGSDCFGYDDEFSRDHDWGPGLCIFISKETAASHGKALEKLYKSLPTEFLSVTRAPVVSTHKRRGVFIIEDFYKGILEKFPIFDEDYESIPDHRLAMAVNGEVFTDPEGEFTKIRNELLKGYPANVRSMKITESSTYFSKHLRYNYYRSLKRGDNVTAAIMLSDAMKEAMKLAHYIENKYPPQEKWLFKSLESLDMASEIIPLIKESKLDALVDFLSGKIFEGSAISEDFDSLYGYSPMTREETKKLTNDYGKFVMPI